jgi:hypothetical protein
MSLGRKSATRTRLRIAIGLGLRGANSGTFRNLDVQRWVPRARTVRFEQVETKQRASPFEVGSVRKDLVALRR